MQNAAILRILVTANTASATGPLTRLDAQLVGTSKKGSAMGAALAKAAKYGVLAFAAGAAASVKAASDFQEQMEKVSTQAGASQGEVKKLSKAVLEYASSGKSAAGPQDLSKALFHIESAGFRGAKAMDLLRSSQKLAAVGGSDLEETTYALTSAMKTGVKGTENLHKTIGTLNAIVGQGDQRMQDLASSLSSGILVTAKGLGVSLTDVGSAMDVMTKQGIPAQNAATSLNMGMLRMATSTTTGAKALASVGISADDLSNTMRNQGLLPAVQMLASHLDDVSKTEAGHVLTDAFGVKSGKAVKTLVLGVGDLKTTIDGVKKNTGDFGEKWQQTQKTASFRFHALVSQVESLAIKFGNKLLPVVSNVMGILSNPHLSFGEKVSKIIDKIGKFIGDAIPKIANAVGNAAPGVAKAFVTGFLNASIWGKLAVGGFLLAKFGGLSAFGGFGKAAGKKWALGFILAVEGVELAKQINQIIQGQKLDATTSENLATDINKRLGLAFDAKGAAQIIGAAGNKVRIANAFGSLIFSADTQKVVSAKGALLQKFIGQIPQQVGPTFLQMERDAQIHLGKLVDVSTTKFQRIRDSGGHQFGNLLDLTRKKFDAIKTAGSQKSQSLASNVSGNVNQMGLAVYGSYSDLVANTQKILKGFNADETTIAIEAPSANTLTFRNKAKGGYIGGSSMRDTVPAMLGAGEAVVNRHQQPHVERALAMTKSMGMGRFGSLGELFGGISTPHYLAKGGFASGTPGDLRNMAGGAMKMTTDAARAYIKGHRPKPTAGGVPGFTGPPANMSQLGNNAWVDSHTLATTAYIDKKFGMVMTDGYRDAATALQYPSGLGTLHHDGSPSNPGATDSAGVPIPTLYRALAWAQQHIAGLQEAQVDNVAGWNLHLGFFNKGGFAGKARRMAKGGWLASVNHPFTAQAGSGGPAFKPHQVAALAEHYGLPGITFMQIARGESAYRPGALNLGGDGGTGLFQITPPFGGSYGAGPTGSGPLGYPNMLNPIKNSQVAKRMYDAWKADPGSINFPWLGTQYMTSTNAHFTGDIAGILGGGSGSSAPKTYPKPSVGKGFDLLTHQGVQDILEYGFRSKLSSSLPSLPRGVKIPKSAGKLPGSIRRLLSGDLKFSDQMALSNQAMSLANETSGMGDNKIARLFQIDLENERIAQIKKLLRSIKGLLTGPNTDKRRKALNSERVGLFSTLLSLRKNVREGLGAGAVPVAANQADLIALLRSQLADQTMRLAVSQAQYPEFGGSFAGGGVVPGPRGAPRIIEAHGGETVTPPGKMALTINNLTVYSDGRVEIDSPEFELAVNRVTRKSARKKSTPGGRMAGR